MSCIVISYNKIKSRWEGEYDSQVIIERSDGMRFCVNIPESEWSEMEEPPATGLNLVFGHGIHYE